MPARWQTVRVFISSTFRDMHAERDYLVKVTFPALREKLLPHRVELYDIDLRWGITEDEAANEKVISLCLEQVDECRPFFLAILGHRYGWVPGAVSDETRKRFPFIDKYPNVSVTELEIRYGVLRLFAGTNVLVLLRDDKALLSIPLASREKDFAESDQTLQDKMAKVKRGLAASLEKLKGMDLPPAAGTFSIQPYSAVWDPKRYDRVSRTEGRLAQLDDFGKQVEDWLWNAIRKELKLPDTPASVDPLDAEADLHERFLELRTRIYAGRDELYRRLCEFALADGETPLLLTGESGLGKSAALARFVRDFRQEHPSVFVLPHFVGASPRTTSLAGMLQRLTRELQRKFHLTVPKAESPDEIIRAFLVAIANLPETARVVLVFDALNQLDAESRAETLIWLPDKLPPKVRVICSSATGPQQALRVLTAFGARAHVHATLEPLDPKGNDTKEREKIIEILPKLVAKTLDSMQKQALLANSATRNPLFLIVALEELRGYGSFERLNQMIAELPHEGDTVTQLFGQVFARLEQEFNEPLVGRTLGLLACARRGLSGPELVELTKDLGEQADDLYPVLRQLRAYLQVRDGLFDFYHLSIRRAVEIRYLQWHTEEDQRDPWTRWKLERQPPPSEPTEPERETRQRLIDYFDANRLAPRSVDELPWQLLQARNWTKLAQILGKLDFLAACWKKDEYELNAYWAAIERSSPQRIGETYLSFVNDPDRVPLAELRVLYALFDHAGLRVATTMLRSALTRRGVQEGNSRLVFNEFIRLAADAGDDGNLQRLESMSRLDNAADNLCIVLSQRAAAALKRSAPAEAQSANSEALQLMRNHEQWELLPFGLLQRSSILRRIGDTAGASAAAAEAMDFARRQNRPALIASCQEYQARVAEKLGDFGGALALLQAAEQCHRHVNQRQGLLFNLAFQAQVLLHSNKHDQALVRLEEQAVLHRSLGDEFHNRSMFSNCLGMQANLLLERNAFDQAERVLHEIEALHRFAPDHAALARCWGDLVRVSQGRGNLDQALALQQKQIALCREHKLQVDLSFALSRYASLLHQRGDTAQALAALQEQEALCRTMSDPQHLVLCLAFHATLLQEQGNWRQALPRFEEAAALCNKAGDTVGLTRCIGGQGLCVREQGDLDRALALFAEQERLARQNQDNPQLSLALSRQARVRDQLGDMAGALRKLEEQEPVCRTLDDQTGLRLCLGGQALYLQSSGDLDGARARLEQVEPLCRQDADVAVLRDFLVRKGELFQKLGDVAGAEAAFAEALQSCSPTDKLARARVTAPLAMLLANAGAHDRAEPLLREAEALCRETGDHAQLAVLLSRHTMVLLRRQDLDGGETLAREADALFRRLGIQQGMAQMAQMLELIRDLRAAAANAEAPAADNGGNEMAELIYTFFSEAEERQRHGDLAGAIDFFERMGDVCRHQGDLSKLGVALERIARLRHELGDLAAAFVGFDEVEQIYTQLQDSAGLFRVFSYRAFLEQERGDIPAAFAMHRHAEVMARRLDTPESLIDCFANQAILLAIAFEQPSDALPLIKEAVRLAVENDYQEQLAKFMPVLTEVRRMCGMETEA